MCAWADKSGGEAVVPPGGRGAALAPAGAAGEGQVRADVGVVVEALDDGHIVLGVQNLQMHACIVPSLSGSPGSDGSGDGGGGGRCQKLTRPVSKRSSAILRWSSSWLGFMVRC